MEINNSLKMATTEQQWSTLHVPRIYVYKVDKFSKIQRKKTQKDVLFTKYSDDIV